MKNFFRWFKNQAKMKRWLLVILVGIVALCYGVSELLIVNKTLDTSKIGLIVASFIVGVLLVIISIVKMNSRVLEILVEESDTRKDSDNVNSLIFNKKVYNQGPKIVVIGGGSGLNTVLRGLKNYTDNITAIVTVSDYGETPTDSREALKVLPMDDIKQSLAALAYDEPTMDELLNTKFDDGKLKNLSFGDIYFLAMDKMFNNFTESVKSSGSVLNITGKVLPVTLEPIKICAELDDGTVIESRDKIPEIVDKTKHKITRIYLSPTNCQPAPGVIDAITEADAIIIGPGSLYTNVIPNLLVKGITRAIKESNAIKVYVSNIMTELGQTDEYTLSDHIKAIQDYLGYELIDYCIYDTGEIIPEYIQMYNLKGSDIVLPDTNKAKAMGVKLVQRNLSMIEDDNIRHDPDVIASTIIQLVCDELEFNDMENDSQYMLLNNRLQETKREKRRREKKEKKFQKSGKKTFERKETDSKFKEKYKERIGSIEESQKKADAKINKEKQVRETEANLEENLKKLTEDSKD
jgi:uncharacterized cofD-like protein